MRTPGSASGYKGARYEDLSSIDECLFCCLDRLQHTCRRCRKDGLFTFCSAASRAAGGAADGAAALGPAPSEYEPRVKDEFASPDMPEA